MPTKEEIARIIHISGVKSVYFPTGNLKSGDKGYATTVEAELKRRPFPPVDSKEFREMRHYGLAHIDIALDQAKALMKAFDIKDI